MTTTSSENAYISTLTKFDLAEFKTEKRAFEQQYKKNAVLRISVDSFESEYGFAPSNDLESAFRDSVYEADETETQNTSNTSKALSPTESNVLPTSAAISNAANDTKSSNSVKTNPSPQQSLSDSEENQITANTTISEYTFGSYSTRNQFRLQKQASLLEKWRDNIKKAIFPAVEQKRAEPHRGDEVHKLIQNLKQSPSPPPQVLQFQKTYGSVNEGFYGLSMNLYDGTPFDFSLLRHHVVLIVNMAPYCHFRHQMEQFEELYQKYKDRGLVVIGFMSNSFFQTPHGDAKTANLCQKKHKVSYPITEKVKVTGAKIHNVYRFLKSQPVPKELVDKMAGKSLYGVDSNLRFGARVRWNFEKFLVDSNGNLVKRFSIHTTPDKLERYVEELL